MDGTAFFTTTTTRNIGANKGKPRLWIEGQSLIDAGLDHGARWDITDAAPGAFTICRAIDGKRKIAGKPGRPIIDMTGKTLTDIGFQSGDVAVLRVSTTGSILITKQEW